MKQNNNQIGEAEDKNKELKDLMQEELDYLQQIQDKIINLCVDDATLYTKQKGGFKSVIYVIDHCELFTDKIKLYYSYLIKCDFHEDGYQLINSILIIIKKLYQTLEKIKIKLITGRLKFLIHSIIKYEYKVDMVTIYDIGHLDLHVEYTKEASKLK